MPKHAAEELKKSGSISSKRYQTVTVLFADIYAFTKIAEEIKPEKLIYELDKFYASFDSIIEKYNIEKIKTIGDSYLCVAGIPDKNSTNYIEMLIAAIEIQDYFENLNNSIKGRSSINKIRIGIHTGPVIAGAVGKNKVSYDIWGDTVNIANRIETNGEVGKINISDSTYNLIKDYFDCEYRGKIQAKNKGEIDMFFVKSIKKEYSDNYKRTKPNLKLMKEIQNLRFNDVKKFIIKKLKKELSPTFYYHDYKHTTDVLEAAIKIGKDENLNEDEMLLLKTAALFHDTGFLFGYNNHEENSAKYAEEILSKHFFTKNQIQKIKESILSTKAEIVPSNKLEKIMCDADLDYLGRSDFIEKSNMLFKELHEEGLVSSYKDWNETQIEFIFKHKYYTKYARENRDINKSIVLEKLGELI